MNFYTLPTHYQIIPDANLTNLNAIKLRLNCSTVVIESNDYFANLQQYLVYDTSYIQKFLTCISDTTENIKSTFDLTDTTYKFKRVFISNSDKGVSEYNITDKAKEIYNIHTNEDQIDFFNKTNNDVIQDITIVSSQIITSEMCSIQLDEYSNLVSIVINKLPIFCKNNYLNTITYLGTVAIELVHPSYSQMEEANNALLENDVKWSSATTIDINIKNNIIEGLRSRYLFVDRPKNGLANVVVDSFLPRLLYKYKLDVHNMYMEEKLQLPKTSVAISPFTANIFNIKQIPITQLIRILGYTEKYIKELFKKVKELQYTFVYAGAGGTGINTAVWMYELANMSNVINIFKKIYVFDNDTVEFSNLLRFPINPSVVNIGDSTYKIKVIAPYLQKLSLTNISTHRSYLANGYLPYELFTNERVRTESGHVQYNYTTREKVVLYGAPSLEFRNLLSKCGNFISATHMNNECSLYLNPYQEESLQVESYGMIQLNSFYMNQLKMTIMLLEFLATNPNLKEQDKLINSFEFKGNTELTTDRVYNFQLSSTSNMLTETAAINF